MSNRRGVLLENLLGFLPGSSTLGLVNPDLLLVVTNSTHAVVWAEFDLRDPPLGMFESLDVFPFEVPLASVTGDDP